MRRTVGSGPSSGRVAARARVLFCALLLAALLLVPVQVAHFAYYAAGITQQLWKGGQRFYFSENHVLHVGMIGWLAYLLATIGRHLCDDEIRSGTVTASSRESSASVG